jgi:UDP-N-acetylglucosamine 4-epimerase
MTAFDALKSQLPNAPKVWLVTGASGFIGSNLVEALLRLNQTVRGLDNFATGHQRNLTEVQALVTPQQWAGFSFSQEDIRDLPTCQKACQGVDYILHQAALGSVPRSIEDPLTSHAANVTGFLNMLVAARDSRVSRFVYASSSSVYGDHPGLPKLENQLGKLLSPYAATKLANEIYAEVFAQCYGVATVGLRYFNVFGARQDPEGAYAAVIPKWIAALIKNEPVYINGDGETSRDFCYVENVVQANLLAATVSNPAALNQAYNVAVNERTTLNQLFYLLRDGLAPANAHLRTRTPEYRDFRPGDVRHSLADISKAAKLLGYAPTHRIAEGLAAALDWYQHDLARH